MSENNKINRENPTGSATGDIEKLHQIILNLSDIYTFEFHFKKWRASWARHWIGWKPTRLGGEGSPVQVFTTQERHTSFEI